jgi:riboflavin synthase
MFTGIIAAVGKLQKIEDRSGDKRVTIETGELDMSDVALGDSIAVNGVCLTVIEFDAHRFAADVSVETIEHTGFKHYSIGQAVNLEKALRATDRLGGHLVSGHVDGIGEVLSIAEDARSWRFEFAAPKAISHYIAHKGSITIDGISLTVNQVNANRFSVNIVPHTLKMTSMHSFKQGTQVNLEVDLIARYLERLLTGDQATDASNTRAIDIELLAKTGFIK